MNRLILEDAADAAGDRYDRQRRITWWDQDVLSRASVLVVGAGALGNELVKNLALLGVGRISVIDLDTIETSNLSRGVFFRDTDTSASKAEVVAMRTGELNPDVEVTAYHGDVTHRGLGWFTDFDLVLGGLDNRETRVWVNQAVRKLRRPWIDGAIEGLRGVARVFLPDGPCYECTLSAVDRQILARRQSCALLTLDEIVSGKVPTTATTASIIAGIQAQEAVKVLHGRLGDLALANRSFMFMGDTMDTWIAEHGEDPACPAHDRYETLVPTSVGEASMRDLAERAGLSAPVVAVDLERDIVVSAICSQCDSSWQINRAVTSLTTADIRCDGCEEVPALQARRSISPAEPLAALPLRDLGFPDRDVLTLRTAGARQHLELRFPC